MFAEGGRALVPVAFHLVKLRHAPGDFHPPLYLPTLSASPTTIVALRTTQTTNQGFVSFAASPNNTLERVTVAPAIGPATSGLIALPSVPPAEQVRLSSVTVWRIEYRSSQNRRPTRRRGNCRARRS